MAFNPIGGSYGGGFGRGIAETRELLARLQEQLGTGKRATTYGGLGVGRTESLSIRNELSKIAGYRQTIGQANIRVDVMQTALGRIRELAAETRSGTLDVSPLTGSGQSEVQLSAAARFNEVASLLNTEIDGRYLFGGRSTETPPLAPSSEIMDGAGTRAGFRQIAEERRLADLNTDGLGRLTLSSAGNGVTLTEQSSRPFGFKIAAVSSGLSGTTVTGPSGAPPGLAVAFSAAPPVDGQTIRVTLALPDGSQEDVTLTARSGAPANAGEFQIGANAAATAASFRTALETAIGLEAKTTLAAASTFAAADDYFDANPPQRVDGPPFETATAQRDGTAGDTVFWYPGEAATGPARSSVLAKTDDSVMVAYGARADEAAFRNTLKSLAALSVQAIDPADPAAGAHNQAVRARAGSALATPPGTQSIDDIVVELGVAKTALGRAEERHKASETVLTGYLGDAEGVDIYEVSAQILALRTRLEASLQVTANLSQLSLVNFI